MNLTNTMNYQERNQEAHITSGYVLKRIYSQCPTGIRIQHAKSIQTNLKEQTLINLYIQVSSNTKICERYFKRKKNQKLSACE